MKKIWSETITIGQQIQRFKALHGDAIIPRVTNVTLIADGRYDAVLRHTLLDLDTRPGYRSDDEPQPWLIEARLTADGHATREAATRWIIAMIEQVSTQVRNLIPPPDERSDDEVRRAASES
jgi:hypothetical protein